MTSLSVIAIILAVCFALLTLVYGRGKGLRAWVLSVALLVVAALELCDLMAVLRPAEWVFWKQGALFAESLLPGVWLLFAVTFAREGGLRDLSLVARLFLALALIFPAAVLLVPVESFFFSPDFGEERLLFLGRWGYFFSVALLMYLVYILIQLERTLVSTPRSVRWRGKFELIGAGTLMAALLIYYSQGLLHKTIDMHLLPLRSLALSAAVVMMGWSRLRRPEAPAIRVSREMAYRSVVVLAVGLYLVGLGLLGEGMRYLGDAQRRSILMIGALFGGLAVVTIFLSEIARRKIRVFLQKNFYREKYDYREQWMRFTRKLSGAGNREQLYRAVLAFFAETFAVRGAALFLRDGDTYRAVSCQGFDELEQSFGADSALVRSFGEEGWIFNRRDEHPGIESECGDFLSGYEVSFVVPLRFDGSLEGFVALGRSIDDAEEYSFEDYDLMKMLALQATSTILSTNLTEQLAQAREMAAIGKVSAFVLHDLKNLVSNLSLVVDTARDHADDPEYRQDMLQTLTVTVGKMKDLISRLKNMEEKSGLQRSACDLHETIREGVRLAGARLSVQGERVWAHIDPAEIQKVALNLVLNAVEAGQGYPVRIETGEVGRPFFRVIDQGCGMSEEFIRKRLFRPFETTKAKGFGIGLYQCKVIVEAHGGTIDVRSREGQGTQFTVWLPKAQRPYPEIRSRNPGSEGQKLTSPDAA